MADAPSTTRVGHVSSASAAGSSAPTRTTADRIDSANVPISTDSCLKDAREVRKGSMAIRDVRVCAIEMLLFEPGRAHRRCTDREGDFAWYVVMSPIYGHVSDWERRNWPRPRITVPAAEPDTQRAWHRGRGSVAA